MSRKRPSGSPIAQNERRKAYRKQGGPVSNPGQPSSVNRKARREPMNDHKLLFAALVRAGAQPLDLPVSDES